MQPLPGPLVDAARHWRTRELVWITRHGIRMSGMPAWAGRLADDDIWATVAFVQQLPQLLPAGYALMRSRVREWPCDSGAAPVDAKLPAVPAPGDARLGRASLQRHGCQGCHRIPGVVGGDRHVGPPLAGFARRTLIAGRLPNTPANLAAWIRAPQAIDPGTAMPGTPVDEAEALAMAAYLGTLR
jgi:cytochrome c2